MNESYQAKTLSSSKVFIVFVYLSLITVTSLKLPTQDPKTHLIDDATTVHRRPVTASIVDVSPAL